MIRNEYPRPNFKRKNWQSLNGTWKFSFDNEKYVDITVPFCYQSELSGIGTNEVHDYIYYKKEFSVSKEWKNQRIILNFGAVDYSCKVYINEKYVGKHEGGSVGFSFDITDSLTYDKEVIFLEIYDPWDDETIPRGKQAWKKESHDIWYTRTSGIWQSVWLEPINENHIKSVKFTPNIDSGQVEINLLAHTNAPEAATFTIIFEDKEILEFTHNIKNGENKLTVDLFENKIFRGSFHGSGWCWSPENPKLFYVDINFNNDIVSSYFGMRKISTANGMVYLNNKTFYQKLILDQGYWKDGIMTAPTDEDFKKDILLSKEMGFNGCRKHQKTEDPRFMYWADVLGYVIWAEVASCPAFSNASIRRFENEWFELVERDFNSPSIVAWVPINESWGVPNVAFDKREQSYTLALYNLLHALDETRLVISNDGWEMTKTDICAFHSYAHGQENDEYKKNRFHKQITNLDFLLNKPIHRNLYADGYTYQGEPILLTEFGGIALNTKKDSKDWGYTSSNSEEDFLVTYNRILNEIYSSDFINGYCYTQLTDVEQEVNGLLTADRKFKIKPEEIKKINDINN